MESEKFFSSVKALETATLSSPNASGVCEREWASAPVRELS
jgi:hypothetical protein